MSLINADGSPLVRSPPVRGRPGAPARPRAALSGADSWAFPYDASSWYARETDGWLPYTYSPDHEINVYRDRMVGRMRDLTRNDGWFSGAIMRILDATIGGSYQLIAEPDYEWLAHNYGPAFDEKWADEYAQAQEAEWRIWAEGPEHFCDATKQLTISQLFYLALRHKLVDGEPLAALEWHPERVGYGGARYATCLRLLDPDRLSNPMEMIDTAHRRGGVQLDDDGAPVGYHIRRAHQLDWYDIAESMVWDFHPRETRWGRRIILHDYDRDRVEQHRGLGVFTPVLNRAKMLTKFDSSTLQAAVIAAIMSMSLESPYDPEGLKELLQTGDEDALGSLRGYSMLRNEFHRDRPLNLANVNVIPTFPGEQIKPIPPAQPSPQYDPFSNAILRHIASQTGQGATEVSQDYSRLNYSSLRGEMAVAWKTTVRRRKHFNVGFADQVHAGWLEEAHDIADLPMPRNAPDFVEARAAYSACTWIGAPRGYVDQVKEAQAPVLRLDAKTSTLKMEAAEQGHDYRRVLKQQGLERKMLDAEGLPYPAWMGEKPSSSAPDEETAHEQAMKPKPV
jgi:lambda family phage portal protein